MRNSSTVKKNQKVYSPIHIGKKLIVEQGSLVRMYEYDLPLCTNSFLGISHGNQWYNLFNSWMKKQAKVKVYAQKPSKEAKEVIEKLKRKFPTGIELIVFNAKDDPELHINRKDLTEKHFTLVRTPKGKGKFEFQLWTEAHLPEDPHMINCIRYFQRGFSLGQEDRKWLEDYERYKRYLNRIDGKE